MGILNRTNLAVLRGRLPEVAGQALILKIDRELRLRLELLLADQRGTATRDNLARSSQDLGLILRHRGESFEGRANLRETDSCSVHNRFWSGRTVGACRS